MAPSMENTIEDLKLMKLELRCLISYLQGFESMQDTRNHSL